MAVGVAIGASTGKEYPGKLTKKVIWTCIVAAMGGLIFGYDIGISGGVTSMAPFLKSFFPDVYRKERGEVSSNQYCQFNNYKLTMFTSSLYLAALVASFFASAATRSWGRKASMLIGGFSFCVGAIINAAAINVAMLIVGRILLGVGIGFANQSTPLYLSEMAPYKHRGFLNMMFQLSITIGILAANLVNYFTAKIKGGWGWRVSLGGAVVPALIFILGSLTLPDTPNSLLERGKVEEARERLRSIRGADVDIDDEFSDLVSACEQSKKVKHPWANLLRRKYRPQFTFAVMIPFFQQLTGMNVFMFYAPVLFKTMGFGDKASLFSAVITGSVNSAATLVSIATVDKFGRKFLFFIGGAQMFICQMIMTYFIKKKFGWGGHPGVLEKSYADGVVAVICVYIAGFAWSWGPLGWLVPSEIFPLEIRSAAQSINVSVNMIFTFFIAQIFLLLMCNLRWCMFLFFGAFVFVMTIFIWRYLPETKGIPIEEMDSIWREHRVWKKIVPPSDTKENIEITVKDKGDC